MTAGTGLDIGSSDWTAGIGSPGIKSFGSTASTASSGKAVGSESTGMTAGTGETLNRLAGQRASGHQASVHLARQRAPRHLAKAVVSESTGTTVGTGSSGTGLSGSTAGIGSSGIRSFGLPAGTASSGKAVGTES
ncbi:unnamed protein product, partial [Staurois parvus]